MTFQSTKLTSGIKRKPVSVKIRLFWLTRQYCFDKSRVQQKVLCFFTKKQEKRGGKLEVTPAVFVRFDPGFEQQLV